MIDETHKGVVLVTCEDRDTREICRSCLEHAGYRVHVAEDPNAAVALARATPPDIVVTSFPTYTSGGVSVTTRLRLEPLFAQIPMLNLASWTRREDLAAAAAEGVTESLLMPVALPTLIETVDRLTHDPIEERQTRGDTPETHAIDRPPDGIERRRRCAEVN